MAADIWTVAGITIALAVIDIGLFAWLRADIRELRGEVKEFRGELGELRTQTAEQFGEMRAQTAAKFEEARAQTAAKFEEARTQTAEQFGETNAQLGQLRERMAHLEGPLDGLREAVAGRRAA